MSNLATWFTPSLQTISRSEGRSSVLAAAYRACTVLTDERLGITRDFTPKGKRGLAQNICIGIPNNDIGKLFNDAEKAESRANSTVSRELMVPLPSAWTDVERAQCARGLGEMLRARYGVAVLVSIHRPSRGNNNDHAHILFTTREVDAEGKFGKKTRILDDAKTGEVKKMRELVCEIVNVQAEAQGDNWYVYAGKFSDIMDDYVPTKHISIRAGKNQKARINANRNEVAEARKVLAQTKIDIAAIDAKIEGLQIQPVVKESGLNAAPMPDKSDKGVTVSKPANERLKRIPMPDGAEEARAQTEKALFSRETLKQEFAAWQDMHTQLLAHPPEPQYGFFGRPKANYKVALKEYLNSLQAADEAMKDRNEKAAGLLKYIAHPQRQKLHTLYKETIAHNAKVDAYERELKQQLERKPASRNDIDSSQEKQKSYLHREQLERENGYDSHDYGM